MHKKNQQADNNYGKKRIKDKPDVDRLIYPCIFPAGIKFRDVFYKGRPEPQIQQAKITGDYRDNCPDTKPLNPDAADNIRGQKKINQEYPRKPQNIKFGVPDYFIWDIFFLAHFYLFYL
jgi:hypothetical protein